MHPFIHPIMKETYLKKWINIHKQWFQSKIGLKRDVKSKNCHNYVLLELKYTQLFWLWNGNNFLKKGFIVLCTAQPSLFKQSWQASRPCLWGIHLAICESLQISLKEASKSYYRLTFNFFCIAILISHIFSFRFRFHFLTFVYFLNAKKIACKVVKCRT